MILATCLYFSYHFKLTQKKLLCLCDGIGRHARLKTLSIMGPGSSPGAGNILNFLLKWLTALFTVLFFPQKLYNHMNMVLFDYTTQFTPCLEDSLLFVGSSRTFYISIPPFSFPLYNSFCHQLNILLYVLYNLFQFMIILFLLFPNIYNINYITGYLYVTCP